MGISIGLYFRFRHSHNIPDIIYSIPTISIFNATSILKACGMLPELMRFQNVSIKSKYQKVR